VEGLDLSSPWLTVPRLSFSPLPSDTSFLDFFSDYALRSSVRAGLGNDSEIQDACLLLLVFSLNTNICIPTSEEQPAMPLYPYESQMPKLCCT